MSKKKPAPPKRPSRAARRSQSQSAAPLKGATLEAFGQRWPLERDILWRPERMKYVRKLVKTPGCVFCQARDQGPSSESLVLLKTRHAMAVLNKYPYNTGHLLVLPLRHCGEIGALDDNEFYELHNLLRHSLAALKTCYDCPGFNVGLNLGAAGGAGIPEHLHYHLVPRWAGDANFFPLIAGTKVMIETLDQTYAKLEPAFARVFEKMGSA